MKRSWEGAVLKMFGGKDFRLAVTGREEINPQFVRIHVDGGSLLDDCGVHPTMWIRLWFDDDGKPHQRAFTLVNPNPGVGTFSLDFALHEGRAADWARRVQPGETIEATVQGSRFDLPDPAPSSVVAVGDPASIPAINSLLAAIGDVPAMIWLEYIHDEDRALPLHTQSHHTVNWVPRRDGGSLLVDEVCGSLSPAAGTDGAYYWLACEASSTRRITRHLRKNLSVDKARIRALGYWRAE
ncbi:MAG: FAD-binding protein [Pseudarthrobacter sp.]|nr:FAD-binding protein [Pseudarthrobacter sp.]